MTKYRLWKSEYLNNHYLILKIDKNGCSEETEE